MITYLIKAKGAITLEKNGEDQLGPIMSEVKKGYKESRRRGISYEH